jgi:hypothetical protein
MFGNILLVMTCKYAVADLFPVQHGQMLDELTQTGTSSKHGKVHNVVLQAEVQSLC